MKYWQIIVLYLQQPNLRSEQFIMDLQYHNEIICKDDF